MAQDKLPVLEDMFPSLARDILEATLHAHSDDLEGAIGALLAMCVDDTIDAVASAPASSSAAERRVTPETATPSGRDTLQAVSAWHISLPRSLREY